MEVAGLHSLYDTWGKYVGAIWGTPKTWIICSLGPLSLGKASTCFFLLSSLVFQHARLKCTVLHRKSLSLLCLILSKTSVSCLLMLHVVRLFDLQVLPRVVTKALQNKWQIIFRFPKEKTTLRSKRTLQFYNQLTPGCVDLTFSFQRVFVSANTSWLKKCLKKRKFIPWQMCCWGLAHSEKHRGDNCTGFWVLTRPLYDSCGTDGSCVLATRVCSFFHAVFA